MSERPGGPLLVLGASVHQLDVIDAARRRGIRIVVVDNISSNPGHRIADSSYVVSTTDVDAVERIAREEAARGIIAAGTDVAVPTAAIVAERVGLPGAPAASASLVTSKSAFREWQREVGATHPEWMSVSADAKLPASGRWIVKPDRSSGAKDTRIATGGDDLPAAVAAAASGSGVAIVERIVEGHHVTIEALLADGEVVWAMMLDRQTAAPPWCATVGHRLPTAIEDRREQEAIAAVAAVTSALGLREGPVDADLVIGDENVVLELSPRLGGNGIVPLAELSTGVRLADAAIDVALGSQLRVPSSPRPAPAAVVLLGAASEGVLAYDVDEVDGLRAEQWVRLLEIEAQGRPVRPFVDGRAAVGRALITAEDRAGIDRRAAEVAARVAVEAR